MSDPVNDKYISYNGLNRPALQCGVPLMILLPMVALGLFSTFTGIYFFGMEGATPALIIILILFFIRIAVENDPRGLDVFKLKVKGFFLKRNKILLIKDSHEKY